MEVETEEIRLEKDSAGTGKRKKSKKKLGNSNNHIVKKRPGLQVLKTKKDVYVNNKTPFQVFLKRCEAILESDEKEVIIHGLGKAVTRACNLALKLQKDHHNTLQLDTTISSVTLTDDLEPINDDAEYGARERTNPAIHIRVSPIINIGSLRFDKQSTKN